MDVEIGERIIDKDKQIKGTLRWKGKLPVNEETWYGIEWDTPDRGTHRGEYKGSKIFTCEYETTSASFTKLAKLQKGVDFIKSLQEKYSDIGEGELNDSDSFVFTESQQKVQIEILTVAKKKKNQFADLSARKTISLSDAGISHYNNQENKLDQICPEIEDLDISDNLFSNWNEIEKIIAELKKLYCLNLSGNYLKFNQSSLRLPNTIKILVLHRMHLTWEDINSLENEENEIEELHVCYNKIRAITPLSKWNKLKLLNLEENGISDFSESLKAIKTYFPSLNKFILSGNPVSDFIIEENAFQPQDFASISSVSLSNTKINKWETIDLLNELFPQLKEIRLSNIELFKDVSHLHQRYFIISRFCQLTRLNGSEIPTREREDAEKYYLAHLYERFLTFQNDSPQQIEFKKQNKRFNELLTKYGVPSLSGAKDEPHSLSSSMLKLSLFDGVQMESKTIPASTLVKNVKVMINHLFKIRTTDQKLYYKRQMNDLTESFLDDDDRALSYYAILSGGLIIIRKQ